jgi:hypothetical protein
MRSKRATVISFPDKSPLPPFVKGGEQPIPPLVLRFINTVSHFPWLRMW